MLTVAYDGTNYSGWQIQPNAETIEGILDREISRLTNETVHVIGASRTDAGVHAKGAIAVFDTSSFIPGEKFSYALNTSLPSDIRIVRSKEVASDFHPRKVPTKKTYEYKIWNDTFEDPTVSRYAHHIYGKLDIDAMNEAAKYLIGEHDFAGFCSVHTQAETTVRTIYDIHVRISHDDERLLIISVTGNGFLYNMVRIIAGTLIDVGQGTVNPVDMPDILASCDRSRAGDTAPAKGLTLLKYEFL